MPANMPTPPPARDDQGDGLLGDLKSAATAKLLDVGLHLTQGWVVRQAAKWGAFIVSNVSTMLIAQGLDSEHSLAISGAVSSLVLLVVESAFSFVSMKIAPKAQPVDN